ncbi:hypothetical protein [Actinoplanes sp. NPDC049265]|uniref:hypothetical protein n=1 Tax=Actinoplanes sp. NPDC049265 TaxID=3363902 RepID=UPI003711A617
MPNVVRWASRLLLGAAVLAVPLVVAGVLAWLHLDGGSADAYTGALAAAGGDADDAAAEVGRAIGFDTGSAVVVGLVAGYLGRMVRFPLRWARAAALVTAVVAWALLGCGLAAPAEGPTWSEGREPAELVRARTDLLSGWYPGVHSVFAFFVLAALTAAAVLLLREAAADYYRRTDGEAAPDWTSFTPK